MNVIIPGQGKVIGFYGPDAQSMVHCEECAELIQAISKMRRNPDDEAYENLVEEAADVLVCIEQILEMYEIPDHHLQQVIDQKCARQEARMDESLGRNP